MVVLFNQAHHLTVAAAVFGGGYGQDVFLVAVLHLEILASILGQAGHWEREAGGRQVERVGRDEVETSSTPALSARAKAKAHFWAFAAWEVRRNRMHL